MNNIVIQKMVKPLYRHIRIGKNIVHSTIKREIKRQVKTLTRMIKRQKSIFFVSLPKSGTVYTWNSVANVTGLEIPDFHSLKGWHKYSEGIDYACPKLYASGDYNTQMLLPDRMKYYAYGYFFGAHMQASYHNMKALEHAGIDRIVVLLRDPRDALVSWVHHLKKLGKSARDYHSKIYHIPRDYYDWPIEKQFDYQIRTFLPTVINWVEGWLDYYASPDRKIDVQFVLYDELKRDPVNYIRKIVTFNGVRNADLSKVAVPEKGKMHFRKGEHDQWKTDFSEHDQQLANELLQDRIIRAFNRAALAHRNIRLSEQEIECGNFNNAARLLLEVLEEFSNSIDCYVLFFRALSLLGVDVSQGNEMIKAELTLSSVESCFIYRGNMLNECKKLLNSTMAS